MGVKNSKEDSWRQHSSFRSASSSSSSSWNSYPQSSYGHESQPQPPYSSQPYYTPPPQNYGAPPPQNYYEPYAGSGVAADGGKRLDRRYSRIADNYNSLEEVSAGFLFW